MAIDTTVDISLLLSSAVRAFNPALFPEGEFFCDFDRFGNDIGFFAARTERGFLKGIDLLDPFAVGTFDVNHFVLESYEITVNVVYEVFDCVVLGEDLRLFKAESLGQIVNVVAGEKYLLSGVVFFESQETAPFVSNPCGFEIILLGSEDYHYQSTL